MLSGYVRIYVDEKRLEGFFVIYGISVFSSVSTLSDRSHMGG